MKWRRKRERWCWPLEDVCKKCNGKKKKMKERGRVGYVGGESELAFIYFMSLLLKFVYNE